MKITKEELQQIIREELEDVLDEGVFGPKIGRKLSPTKYDYDRKDKPRRHVKAKDLEYKGDDYDIDDINQKIADKLGGKYKKLKEEEDSVEGIVSALSKGPDGDVLNRLYYKVKDLPSSNPAQEKAKKMAAGSVGSALKNVDATGAVNLGRENFIKRAIKHLSDYKRADSVDVQEPTME